MKHTINDRITAFTSLPALREGTFIVLDAVQGQKPELRFLAPATAFTVMAQELGRDAHNDLERVRRIIRDAEGPFTYHIQAIRDYVRGEMGGRA